MNLLLNLNKALVPPLPRTVTRPLLPKFVTGDLEYFPIVPPVTLGLPPLGADPVVPDVVDGESRRRLLLKRSRKGRRVLGYLVEPRPLVPLAPLPYVILGLHPLLA